MTKEDGSQSVDAKTEVVMEQEAMEIASSLFFDLNDDSDAEDDATNDEKQSSREVFDEERNEEFGESADDDNDLADPQKYLTKAKLGEQKTQSKYSTSSSTVTAAQHLIQKFQLSNEAGKSSGREATRRGKQKQKNDPEKLPNVYMQKAKKLSKGLKQNPVFQRNLSFQSKQEQKRQSSGPGKPEKTSYIGSKGKSTQKMKFQPHPATNTKNETIDLTSPQEKKCQATKVSVKIICEKGPETTKETPKGVIHRVEKAVQIITTKTRVDNQSNNEGGRQLTVNKFKDNESTETTSVDAANPLRVRERNIQRLKDLIRKQEQAIERIKSGEEAEQCDNDGVMSSTESRTEPTLAKNTSLPRGESLITKIGINSALQNKGISIGSLREMKGTFEKSDQTPTLLTIQGNKVTPKVCICQDFHTISPAGSTQKDPAAAKLPPASSVPVTAIVGRSQEVKSNMLPKIAGVCSLAGVRHSKPKSTAIELNFNLEKNKNNITNISSPRQELFTSTAATATNIQIEDGNNDTLDVNRMREPVKANTTTQDAVNVATYVNRIKSVSNEKVQPPDASAVTNVDHPTTSVNQRNSVSSINVQILGMIPALKNSISNLSSVPNVNNNLSEPSRSELFNKLLNSHVTSQQSKTSTALTKPTVVPGSQLSNKKTTLTVATEQSKQSNKGHDTIKEQVVFASTTQHNSSTIKLLESTVNSIASLENKTDSRSTVSVIQPRPGMTNLVPLNLDSSSSQAANASNLEAAREKLKNVFNTKLKPPKVIVVPNTNSSKITVNQRINSAATVASNTGSNSKIIMKPYPIASSEMSYGNRNPQVVSPNLTTASNSAAPFHSQQVQYQRVVLVQNNGKYALMPVQDPNVPGSFLVRVNSKNSTMASNCSPPVNGNTVNQQVPAFPQRLIGNVPVPVSLNHLTGQFSQMPRLAFIQPVTVPKGKEATNINQDTDTVRYSALHGEKTSENGQDYSALNSLGGYVCQSSKSITTSSINNAALQSMHQASMPSTNQQAMHKTVRIPDLEMITDSGHVSKMPPENTKAASSIPINTISSKDNNESFDTSPYWFKKASKGKNALPENVRFSLPYNSNDEKVFEELCCPKKSKNSTGKDFYLRLGLFENQFCLTNIEKKPWRFLPKHNDEDFLELIGLETTIDALKCSFPLPTETLSPADGKKDDRKNINQDSFANKETNVAEKLIDTNSKLNRDSSKDSVSTISTNASQQSAFPEQITTTEKSIAQKASPKSIVLLSQPSAQEKSKDKLTNLQLNFSLRPLPVEEKSRDEITNPKSNGSLRQLLTSEKSIAEATNPKHNISLKELLMSEKSRAEITNPESNISLTELLAPEKLRAEITNPKPNISLGQAGGIKRSHPDNVSQGHSKKARKEGLLDDKFNIEDSENQSANITVDNKAEDHAVKIEKNQQKSLTKINVAGKLILRDAFVYVRDIFRP